MKPEKDRQQAVKLLLYLAEIAVLTAAVFLVVRFLPGGDRPRNCLPERETRPRDSAGAFKAAGGERGGGCFKA